MASHDSDMLSSFQSKPSINDRRNGCELLKDVNGEAFHLSASKILPLQRLWYDKWMSECAHLGLGIICLAAIVALLASYNDASLPLNLPLGLTMSAYLSTLAAVAKYALAVPLDECLGAQKWLVRNGNSKSRRMPSDPPTVRKDAYITRYPRSFNLELRLTACSWYQTPEPTRPLLDFEKFDDAARDPISAIGLLCRVRTRSEFDAIFKARKLTAQFDRFRGSSAGHPVPSH